MRVVTKHLKPFSSTELLAMLVAMLNLQILAVNCKRGTAPIHKLMPYPVCGICWNVASVPEGYAHVRLRKVLFQYCPSNAYGYGLKTKLPVKPADEADYASTDPEEFWGDHPYANNRRQIIHECIQQLQVELKLRGYDV